MTKNCSCQKKFSPKKPFSNNDSSAINKGKYFSFLALGIISWWLIYTHLLPISRFITYDLLSLSSKTRLGESLEFFFYDVPKVLMLLILVSYFVGLLRTFITPEKTKKIIHGKKEITGNFLAALLGIITPFCSCSAIPLFIGFVTAGIPLGVTFSFLIAAPMINEIALVLLYGLLGWKIAALYLCTGLSIAIFSGIIIGHLKMEKYIESWVKSLDNKQNENEKLNNKINFKNRFDFAWQSTFSILKRAWLFMIIGIAVGAGIHGYIPQSFMASVMGKNTWWSVPLAIIIGVPMYSNAAGIVPIVQVLLSKGAALGTTLAFMMSVIALSLPEVIILRKVLKMQLIYTFIIVVTLGILIVGYLFNFLL